MHKDRSLMSSMAYVKQEPLDQMNDQQHNYQTSVPQGPSSIPLFESSKEETFEMMSSRPGFSTSTNKQEPMSITAQLERQNVSAGNSSLASGSNAKIPQKKRTVRQKKPSEALVSLLSKKQRVSGAFSDQSIEQRNDVTAVSGVNLREEEERLFSGSKEDSQVSEASRKLLDDNGDAELLDPKQERCELVENVSLMSDSSAGNFSLASGSNAKTPQKKPTAGQKKPSEALVSSLSKKQKVSGAFSDQSIEQLNDVTAVNGVNLREEEEQLFSGSKEDSQVSEASRKAVQEEKERLILQKTQLQKKSAEIMAKCGVKGRSSDVEPCLSPLLDDDGDVELLDPKQERCELVENVSSMSDCVEKISSPQSDIICVQGYKVKRSNATILEAIFKKHGDITANCIFKTSSARTYFLEVVCEVVRWIPTNDMIETWEDIECQVSDAEAANINVSWIRAYFEAIHKRKETSENHSLLMK